MPLQIDLGFIVTLGTIKHRGSVNIDSKKGKEVNFAVEFPLKLPSVWSERWKSYYG